MSGCVYASFMWVSMVTRTGVISYVVGDTSNCEPLNMTIWNLDHLEEEKNTSELSLIIHF